MNGNVIIKGKLTSSADGAPVPPVFPQKQIDDLNAYINQINVDANLVQLIMSRRGSTYWMSDSSTDGAGITNKYRIWDQSNWVNQQTWGAPANQVYTVLTEKVSETKKKIADLKQKYQDDLNAYQLIAKSYASTDPALAKVQAESSAKLATNRWIYLVEGKGLINN